MPYTIKTNLFSSIAEQLSSGGEEVEVMMAGGQPRPAEAELQHTEVEVVVKSLSVSFNNADKDLFRYRYAVPVAYKPVIHIKKSFLVKKIL